MYKFRWLGFNIYMQISVYIASNSWLVQLVKYLYTYTYMDAFDAIELEAATSVFLSFNSYIIDHYFLHVD